MNIDLPTQTTQTIEEYLALVPEDKRPALENLRETIRAAAPMAEECISYRILCFKYHGPLVFFAAFPARRTPAICIHLRNSGG